MKIICMLITLTALLASSMAQAVTMYPSDLTNRHGSTSEQLLEVLISNDQHASDDDAGKYIEFMPDRRGYDGVFRIKLANNINIPVMTLKMNFRGPDKREQPWEIMLLTRSGKWIRATDNRNVNSWQWSEISKTIKNADRFIDDKNRITLRYKTDGDQPSQLDYLALIAGETDNPAPNTEPVSIPELEATSTPPANSPQISTSGDWAPGLSWQIQYTGKLNTRLDVDVYNIDLFDNSAATIAGLRSAGKRVICYFSAGSFENWRPDASKFPSSVLGRKLDGWAGERWLDIRQLDILIPIMQARMKLAADKGCNAVDPDNVDGYSNNTGFPLSYNDQLAYNIALAEAAHSIGLTIGLKNDVDQIEDLVNYFDFAVNEECFQYNECDKLKLFVSAGKPVFGIEYSIPESAYCPQANAMNFDFLKKRLELDAWRKSCR